MPTLADTAYPRLRTSPDDAELAGAFTPSAAELVFAAKRTRQPGPRLALLVMLKTFQRLGYFVQPGEVPPATVAHIAAAAGLTSALGELGAYDAASSYRSRLMGLVREHVGVAAYGPPARKAATQAAIEASRGRDDLADIVSAAVEELARRCFELPAFGTLLRIARTARALVNRGYHRRAAAAMSVDTRQRLAALLAVPEGEPRSAWDAVKAPPERPSPQRMRAFLQHLSWLREQTTDEALAGIPDQKLRQFAAEARTLNAADLQRTTEARRLTLVAALLRQRAAAALDEAAEMFVRLTARMHNRAKEALDEHLKRHAGETDALIALLRETVIAAKGVGDPAARLAALDALLLPDADGVIERCEAHAALAGGNHLPLLGRFYKGQRAAFIRFLEHARPVSTSQDRSVEGAIAFLLDHRTHRHPKLAIVREEGRGGKRVARRLVDLSFVPDRWWPLVTGQKGRDPAPREVDRRYFELCLFTQVVQRAQIWRPLPAGLGRLWRLSRPARLLGRVPPRCRGLRRAGRHLGRSGGVRREPEGEARDGGGRGRPGISRQRACRDRRRQAGDRPPARQGLARRGRPARAAAEGAARARGHPRRACRDRALARLDEELRTRIRVRGQARAAARAVPLGRVLLRLRPRAQPGGAVA